jgi:hypothetical protein
MQWFRGRTPGAPAQVVDPVEHPPVPRSHRSRAPRSQQAQPSGSGRQPNRRHQQQGCEDQRWLSPESKEHCELRKDPGRAGVYRRGRCQPRSTCCGARGLQTVRHEGIPRARCGSAHQWEPGPGDVAGRGRGQQARPVPRL